MTRKSSTKLSGHELAQMFADPKWSAKPFLNVREAADLAGVGVMTIYDWSSRGLLASCATKRGKRLRIHRDRFAQFLMKND